MFSGNFARAHGNNGFKINVQFNGSTGQSFESFTWRSQ
jgi:glutamate synthase domain-containing protein 3